MNIYLVIQESLSGEESSVEVTPCIDCETALAIKAKKVKKVLSEGKFKGINPKDYNEEEYAITDNPDRFLIETLYDDFSEDIYIEEKKLESID